MMVTTYLLIGMLPMKVFDVKKGAFGGTGGRKLYRRTQFHG
jgi:hypothetical protein